MADPISDLNLNFALGYAAAGWPIIPLHEPDENGRCSCQVQQPDGSVRKCKSPGKHPRTTAGIKAATTDEKQISVWWKKRYQSAGIGLATGEPSGTFVVDVDTKNDGPLTLENLIAKFGPLPETIRSKTGSGGSHIFFKYEPRLAAIGNIANTKLLPGIDIRTTGGLIILPPSMHVKGQYLWEDGCAPNQKPLVPLPDWLFDALLQASKPEPPQNIQAIVALPEDDDNDDSEDIVATLLCCSTKADGNDGTSRLFAWACRGVEAGLDATDTIKAIRKAAEQRPFPTNFTDSDILKRFEDACKKTAPVKAKVKINFEERNQLTAQMHTQNFVNAYGKDLRYIYTWRTFANFNNGYWNWENKSLIERKIKNFTKAVWRAAGPALATISDSEKRKRLLSYLDNIGTAQGIRSTTFIAQSDKRLELKHTLLDQNHYLFNVKNATIDLLTGKAREPDPADLISMQSSVVYDANALCPLWEKTLKQIFPANPEAYRALKDSQNIEDYPGDSQMIQFIQRYAGLCLTGETKDESFMIWWGEGSNGKTLIALVFELILGDYMTRVPDGFFLVRPGNVNSHPTELASLCNKRFILSNEIEDGLRLNEQRIKELSTQHAAVQARRMREDFWRCPITGKNGMITNYAPLYCGTDSGISRRLIFLEFLTKFWNKEKGETGPAHLRADLDLMTKLRAEASGILNWMIKGCMDYREHGLNVPQVVIESSQRYKAGQDAMPAFLADCYQITDSTNNYIKAESLRDAYISYTQQDIGAAKFKKLVERHGAIHTKRRVGDANSPYVHVFLKIKKRSFEQGENK